MKHLKHMIRMMLGLLAVATLAGCVMYPAPPPGPRPRPPVVVRPVPPPPARIVIIP